MKVVTPKPIGNVTSARIELGYDNFYRYRWSGRADAAATATTDATWLTEDVGTTYGTDRTTKDWVTFNAYRGTKLSTKSGPTRSTPS